MLKKSSTCSPMMAQAAITQNEADRKSTRLNSSHLVISYAVFCLKKKNTTNENATMNRPVDMLEIAETPRKRKPILDGYLLSTTHPLNPQLRLTTPHCDRASAPNQ